MPGTQNTIFNLVEKGTQTVWDPKYMHPILPEVVSEAFVQLPYTSFFFSRPGRQSHFSSIVTSFAQNRHQIAFQRIVADYCCDDDARSHGVNPTKLSSISPPTDPCARIGHHCALSRHHMPCAHASGAPGNHMVTARPSDHQCPNSVSSRTRHPPLRNVQAPVFNADSGPSPRS